MTQKSTNTIPRPYKKYWRSFSWMNVILGVAESAIMFMFLCVVILRFAGDDVASSKDKLDFFLELTCWATGFLIAHIGIELWVTRWLLVREVIPRVPEFNEEGFRDFEKEKEDIINRFGRMYRWSIMGRQALAGFGLVWYMIMMSMTASRTTEAAFEVAKCGAFPSYTVPAVNYVIANDIPSDQALTSECIPVYNDFLIDIAEIHGKQAISGFDWPLYLAAFVAGLVACGLFLLRLADVDILAIQLYGISEDLREQIKDEVLRSLPWYKKGITEQRWARGQVGLSGFLLYKRAVFVVLLLIIPFTVVLMADADPGAAAGSFRDWNRGWFFYSTVLVVLISVIAIGLVQHQWQKRLSIAAAAPIVKEEIAPALLFSTISLTAAEHHTVSRDGTKDSLTGVETRFSFLRRENEIRLHLALLLEHKNKRNASSHQRSDSVEEGVVDQTFSIVYVDLDDFKRINTRFEHRGGDEALKYLGRKMQEFCRKHDGWYAGRLGGDEFAFMVVGWEERAVTLHAEKFRLAVKEGAVSDVELAKYKGLDGMISLSMGVASWRPSKRGPSRFPSASDAEAVRARANSLAHTAKKSGKDRIEAEASSQRDVTSLQKDLRDELRALASSYAVNHDDDEKVLYLSVVAWTIAQGCRAESEKEADDKAQNDKQCERLKELIGEVRSLNRGFVYVRAALDEVWNIRGQAKATGNTYFQSMAEELGAEIKARMRYGIVASYRAGADWVTSDALERADSLFGAWMRREDPDARFLLSRGRDPSETLSGLEDSVKKHYPRCLEKIGAELLEQACRARSPELNSWRAFEIETSLDRKCRYLTSRLAAMRANEDVEAAEELEHAIEERLAAELRGREALIYYDLLVSRFLLLATEQSTSPESA